jgi:hypothetical protein
MSKDFYIPTQDLCTGSCFAVKKIKPIGLFAKPAKIPLPTLLREKMSQNIGSALSGAIEIPLFLKSGVTRFENSVWATTQSFLIPALLMIPSAYLWTLSPHFAGFNILSLAGRFSIEYVLSNVVFLASVFLAVSFLKRETSFLRFVTALNWTALFLFILQAFTFALLSTGVLNWPNAQVFLMIQMVYGLLFQAFLIARCFGVHWSLAIALAAAHYAISQGTSQFLGPIQNG